jgi:hypothetical protein
MSSLHAVHHSAWHLLGLLSIIIAGGAFARHKFKQIPQATIATLLAIVATMVFSIALNPDSKNDLFILHIFGTALLIAAATMLGISFHPKVANKIRVPSKKQRSRTETQIQAGEIGVSIYLAIASIPSAATFLGTRFVYQRIRREHINRLTIGIFLILSGITAAQFITNQSESSPLLSTIGTQAIQTNELLYTSIQATPYINNRGGISAALTTEATVQINGNTVRTGPIGEVQHPYNSWRGGILTHIIKLDPPGLSKNAFFAQLPSGEVTRIKTCDPTCSPIRLTSEGLPRMIPLEQPSAHHIQDNNQAIVWESPDWPVHVAYRSSRIPVPMHPDQLLALIIMLPMMTGIAAGALFSLFIQPNAKRKNTRNNQA